MSYSLDHDEVITKKLWGELANRRKLWLAGKCDYCGRAPSTPSCKFPERHKAAPRRESEEAPLCEEERALRRVGVRMRFDQVWEGAPKSLPSCQLRVARRCITFIYASQDDAGQLLLPIRPSLDVRSWDPRLAQRR